MVDLGKSVLHPSDPGEESASVVVIYRDEKLLPPADLATLIDRRANAAATILKTAIMGDQCVSTSTPSSTDTAAS